MNETPNREAVPGPAAPNSAAAQARTRSATGPASPSAARWTAVAVAAGPAQASQATDDAGLQLTTVTATCAAKPEARR